MRKAQVKLSKIASESGLLQTKCEETVVDRLDYQLTITADALKLLHTRELSAVRPFRPATFESVA